MKALKTFDQAVFGWGSPVTIGVVRIVVGFLALVNFLMISVDFEAWYTERGFVPVWHSEKFAIDSQGYVWRFNLLDHVTDARVTLALYVLLCVACLFTTIGLFTRVASIVMFALIVTFHHRSPSILHSGDTLLRQMAFFIMIAPSGASCSVDRLIRLWKGKATAILDQVSLWPQRLMQFQVTIVYFTTVWHKWTGTHWKDGTATWFVPQLHEFDRFPVPAFMDRQPFVAATTWLTLIVELSVAFLAYAKPMRRYVLLAGVALHAGIEYRFNIPLFSFVMTSTYLAFFDGEEFSRFAKSVGQKLSRWKATLFVPKETKLSVQGEAFLTAIDTFGFVEFQQGAEPIWSAKNSEGKTLNPYQAVLNRAPGIWFMKLAPVRWRKMMDSSVVPVKRLAPDKAVTEAVESKHSEISTP